MVREFSYTMYDTNGATPKQNAINHMNERSVAQNNLAKSGGASVPQFSSGGPQVSPTNSNTSIQRAAGLQLKMDSTAKLQANSGQPIKGGSKKKRKSKRSKSKQKGKKKKSRKYFS